MFSLIRAALLFSSCLVLQSFLKRLTYIHRHHSFTFSSNLIREVWTERKASNSDESKSWQSGKIFGKSKDQKRSRANDPWWMRDEESTNPRTLPKYISWWSENITSIDSKWKTEDLKLEAKSRGIALSSKLKKDEILELLLSSNKKFALNDDGFISPSYTYGDSLSKGIPSCYPDVYEDLKSIEQLRLKISNQLPPT